MVPPTPAHPCVRTRHLIRPAGAGIRPRRCVHTDAIPPPTHTGAQNNSQLGFFFFRREDAEAIVEKIREENPRLARDSKILRVTMDNVYEVRRPNLGLRGWGPHTRPAWMQACKGSPPDRFVADLASVPSDPPFGARQDVRLRDRRMLPLKTPCSFLITDFAFAGVHHAARPDGPTGHPLPLHARHAAGARGSRRGQGGGRWAGRG